MPFARFRLDRFVAGALFASMLSNGVPALAQTGTSSSYAGTYMGATRLVSDPPPGADDMCAPGGPVTFRIQDGRFRFPWHEPSAFHVKISPDGSFYATSGSLLAESGKRAMTVPVMHGRIDGQELVAEYGTRWCRYRLDVSRS